MPVNRAQLDAGFSVLASIFGDVVTNCVWHVNSDIVHAVRRLPRLLENLDKGAEELAEGRLSLHPETIRALKGKSRFDFVFFLLIVAGVIFGGWLSTLLP